MLVGDVVGSPGRDALKRYLALARDQYHVDLCIANGENAAGGFGLTVPTAQEMFSSGVDFITSGNHIFDKREFTPTLAQAGNILRPANYPPTAPGRGSGVISVDGTAVGVVNIMGRTFMPPVDDPFRVADRELEALQDRAKVVIVDLHAEATSEKIALGRYLDGRVSAIFGTHTHVQTADEQILPGGTAYVTDVGMTGPTEGVIGMEARSVIERFTIGFSERFSVQKAGTKQFCAAVVTIDTETGRATDIKRIFQRGIA